MNSSREILPAYRKPRRILETRNIDMQNALSNLSTELTILETLVNEQHNQSNQHVLPVKTIGRIRDYVKAQEAILILFDSENPDWADKKLLGDAEIWKSETTFFRKESVFCNSLPEKITVAEYDVRSEFEAVILDGIAVPVQNSILAPLYVDRTLLGAILFINPMFDMHNERQSGFLQLAVNGFANAIYAEEQHRQLIIRKAELELTHWQIVNSRNTLRTFFDNIPSSVYIVDRSYNIVAINRMRSDRAARPPQELVGEKCYEVMRGTFDSLPRLPRDGRHEWHSIGTDVQGAGAERDVSSMGNHNDPYSGESGWHQSGDHL